MITGWILVPISIVIATIATSMGIGGAVMFSPFAIIGMGLEPKVAVGMGLIVEVFGFASALLGFARKKLISYSIGKKMISWSIPAAIIGVLVNKLIPGKVIIIIFSSLLVLLGMSIMRPEHDIMLKITSAFKDKKSDYKVSCDRTITSFAGVGGFFAGMVSAGIGEINDYVFMNKLKLKGAVAAGTSVFIVSLTVLSAGIVHFVSIAFTEPQILINLGEVLIYCIPGVIIGAQIGVFISKYISDVLRQRLISSLFFGISALLLVTQFI